MPRILQNQTTLRALIVLAITQVIAWGAIGLLAIVGRHVAADLHMTLPVVFSGSSVLFVVTGLLSPVLAKAFARFGARIVMIAGTIIAVPGFLLLASAQGPVTYFLAWSVIGIAGSANLSTSAYILLNEVAGRGARSAIGALMLVTGLSSSLFLPLTSVLDSAFGWRGTSLVYAAMLLGLSLPLCAFGLPRRATAEDATPASAAPGHPSDPADTATFYLITAAVGLNSFVTFGFSAILIELLKVFGLPEATAVAFGSMLGVIQVSARAVDFLGGKRWDGLSTGIFAGIALPLSMTLLLTGGGAWWSVAGFILVYGLGSGALAVARATIPLVFYDKADYARASARIALPLNLMAAMSPPVLAGLLTTLGSGALLVLTILCSSGALAILCLLSRRRPIVAVA